MPYSKLFRSRWAALLWAGGILWTAVDTVGFAPAAHAPKVAVGNSATPADDTDATGMDVDGNDLAVLANVLQGN